jgi:endonuclease YncB( thermonuclease family)
VRLKINTFFVLFFSFVLFGFTSLEDIRVLDGDTIRARADGEEIKIRLIDIDAPEIGQPFGNKSKNFLNELLYEKKVTLLAEGKDRYGRVLGNIFSDESNVNAMMVKFGFAWVYEKYAKKSSLYDHQNQAKRKNLGLWRDNDPIAPWVWRKQK